MDSGACQATVYEVKSQQDLAAKPPPTLLESEACLLLAPGLQSFPSPSKSYLLLLLLSSEFLVISC